MDAHRVAHEDGTWVTTDDGPIHLEQGDTLPEGIHPDEVARLVNGGVIEGFELAPGLINPDELDPPLTPADLPAGNVKQIKARVGTDPEVAQAYLDAENGRETPRPTLVEHLEQVIADADDGTPAEEPAEADETVDQTGEQA